MEDSAATRATLQALREQGIRIALDDFDTGFSSLGYLTRMPIGHFKTDSCFVTALLGGGESEAIVSAVLAMAPSLGLRVTAEGVENVEQACVLKVMACDESRANIAHMDAVETPASAPALRLAILGGEYR